VVSPSLAADLDYRFRLGSKLHVVTNGYDSEELKPIQPQHFDHFAIVYAGTFYPPERVVTPVLEALKRIDVNGPSRECYFHYYGDDGSHVRDEAVRLGLANRIRLHQRVPRSEALAAIRGANVTVVITSVFETPSLRINSVPGKLFETLGLRSPILLIAPPGSDAESLAALAGAVGRFCGTDFEGISSFVGQLMAGREVQSNNTGVFEWKRVAEGLDARLRRHLLSAKA